jgi:branched-chain amino acid transport system permease protein
MKEIFQFALLGIGEGSLIAGIAISLVLFYRGSGTINLSAGAVAMITGYVFWSLKTGFVGGYRFATVPALLISLVAAILQGLVMEYCAFRPLHAAPPLAKLVASLGLFLFAQAGMLLAFGPNEQTEPTILPTNPIHLIGTVIPVDQFILAGGIIVVSAALWAVFRWSGFGLRTRAAAENEVSAMYIGLRPKNLSLINSVLACIIVGMLGVLAAPLITLDSTTLPLLVVPALAAALFARFTSFGIACALGLALGALENIIYYLSTLSWFPTSNGTAIGGASDIVVFVLIVIATFWMGGRIPSRGDFVERRLPRVPKPANQGRWMALALVGGAVCLTVFPYGFRQATMTSIIGAVLALSLVVITGFVGQVSVVQLALAGGTGFLMSHLATSAGLGYPWAVIIAVLAATLLGVLIGIGALRVRGVQLVVVTLAAAVAMSSFWFANPSFGGGLSGAPVRQPSLFGLNLGSTAGFRGVDGQQPSPVLGYGLLVFAILLGIGVSNLRQSGLGRRMLAVRSNERAASAVGINVARVKVGAFAISSFIAGVAGAMYAYNYGSVAAANYSALTAFTVIAFAYVGGITMVSGAVLAGLFMTDGLAQYATEQWFHISGIWILLFGAWAVLSNVIFWPDGIAGGVYQRTRDRAARRTAASALPALATTRSAVAAAAPAPPGTLVVAPVTIASPQQTDEERS